MFCGHENAIELKIIYSNIGESLKIFYCKDCYSVFMYRYQFHFGTGMDNFIIYPGEKERDIEFTMEEYFEILKENKNLLVMDKDDIFYLGDIKVEDVGNIINKLNQIQFYHKRVIKNFLEYFNKNEKVVEKLEK